MDFQKEKAWMVRQDGAAFPCLCHIYGSSEDIEETLYAAQWLYEHTAIDATKELCLSLFKAYGISLSEHRNCVRSILIQIKQRHYRFLDYNFILDHAGDITGAEDGELTELNGHVNQSLNNEFMRVRYGGMYDSEDGNRGLYFRLSNDELLTPEWGGIIQQIINEHNDEIYKTFIVSDEESTGKCRKFYLENGRKAVRTFVSRLEKIITGYYCSDLILIGGRPGVGKTTFMLYMAFQAACEFEYHKAAIFSQEMSKDDIQSLFLYWATQISPEKIKSGDLTEDEQIRLKQASDDLSAESLVLDDTPSVTVSEIKEKLRRMDDVEIVFIDYLQLMRNEKPCNIPARDFSEIAYKLKLMAKELDIPVVLTTQLPGRDDEHADRPPVLQDLREYDTSGQDADVVLFLYRDPEDYKEFKGHAIDVIAAKNRHGPTGKVKLCYNGHGSYGYVSADIDAE